MDLMKKIDFTQIVVQGINRTVSYVSDLLFDKVIIFESDDLFEHLELWLYTHYKKIQGQKEAYVGRSDNGPNGSGLSDKKILYRKIEGDIVIRYKGKRISVYKERTKLENADGYRNLFFNQYTISGVNAKQQIAELLEEAHQFGLLQKNKSIISIYGNDSQGYWQKKSAIRNRSFATVILNKQLKKDLLTDIDDFVDSRDWYTERSIPYKRSYLFTGDPGNGKSTLAQAIATHLGMNIYSLDFSSLSNDSAMRNAFSEMPDNSILLIEDIDSFFNERTNKVAQSKVTFSGFINLLDGVFYKDGLLTIISTNHPELLDSAFLRTGRMDKKVEINNPGVEEINEYLNRFYGPGHAVLSANHYSVVYSMSDVQEFCVSNKTDSKAVVSKLLNL